MCAVIPRIERERVGGGGFCIVIDDAAARRQGITLAPSRRRGSSSSSSSSWVCAMHKVLGVYQGGAPDAVMKGEVARRSCVYMIEPSLSTGSPPAAPAGEASLKKKPSHKEE